MAVCEIMLKGWTYCKNLYIRNPIPALYKRKRGVNIRTASEFRMGFFVVVTLIIDMWVCFQQYLRCMHD